MKWIECIADWIV